MLRIAVDENFHGDIVRGLLRRKSSIDVVRIQDVGRAVSVRQAIDDMLLIVECSVSDEWEGQVRYLPL